MSSWLLLQQNLQASVGANATLATTLGDTTLSATATSPEAATLATTLGSTTLSATATSPEVASLLATLGDTSLVATTAAPSRAQFSSMLDDVFGSATGTVSDAGTIPRDPSLSGDAARVPTRGSHYWRRRKAKREQYIYG